MAKKHHKITPQEEHGPLRKGLKAIGENLGPEYGGQVFLQSVALATDGISAIRDLEDGHGLGDSDIAVPRTTHSILELRKRGTFVAPEQAITNKPVVGV